MECQKTPKTVLKSQWNNFLLKKSKIGSKPSIKDSLKNMPRTSNLWTEKGWLSCPSNKRRKDVPKWVMRSTISGIEKWQVYSFLISADFFLSPIFLFCMNLFCWSKFQFLCCEHTYCCCFSILLLHCFSLFFCFNKRFQNRLIHNLLFYRFSFSFSVYLAVTFVLMMFGCMLTLLFLPFFFCWIFFWNTPCCSFLLFSFWSVKNLHDDDNLKLDLISLNLLVFRFLLLFNLPNFKLPSLFQFFSSFYLSFKSWTLSKDRLFFFIFSHHDFELSLFFNMWCFKGML